MTFTDSPDANDSGNGKGDNGDSKLASETTPLLASSPVATTSDSAIASAIAEDGVSNPLIGKPEDRPLPKAQIFFLCYARLVEPIAFFSIFPYINQMVQENGNCKPQLKIAELLEYIYMQLTPTQWLKKTSASTRGSSNPSSPSRKCS